MIRLIDIKKLDTNKDLNYSDIYYFIAKYGLSTKDISHYKCVELSELIRLKTLIKKEPVSLTKFVHLDKIESWIHYSIEALKLNANRLNKGEENEAISDYKRDKIHLIAAASLTAGILEKYGVSDIHNITKIIHEGMIQIKIKEEEMQDENK